MILTPFLLFSNQAVFAGGFPSKISPAKLEEISPMSRTELERIKREFDSLPEQRKAEWRKTLSAPIRSTEYVRNPEEKTDTSELSGAESKEEPSAPKLSRTASKKVMALTGFTRDPELCPVLSACSKLKERIVRLILSEFTPRQQLSIVVELCKYFGYTGILESDPAIVKKINSGSVRNVTAYINATNGLLEIECIFTDSQPLTISI